MNNEYNQQPVNQPQYNPSNYTVMPQYGMGPMIPEEYKPISAWGYFGYEILFSLPLIGFIFLVIFALGGTRNINLRNFARSYFCILVILAILIGIFIALGGFAALAEGLS